MNKKRKFSLSKLLNNNNFLIIISVVISLIIWINVSLSDNNLSTRTISNIPIQISLSDEAVDNGLRIFSNDDATASVTVSGNRVTIGNLSADDILVSAPSASTILTPGTYPLSITARNASVTSNFNITSAVSPSVLTVYVDYYQEKTFEINKNIYYEIDPEYYGELILSVSEIVVSGPKTEVSKIDHISIEGKVKDVLTSDFEKQYKIKMYDTDGEEYSNSMVTLSETSVTGTIKVYSKKEVPLKAKFKNQPDKFDLSNIVTLDSNKVTIIGDAEVLDTIECVYTDEIDFSTLDNSKVSLDVGIDIPEQCVILNNIESVNVNVDLSDFNKKTIKVNNIESQGVQDGYKCNVLTDSLVVTIYGSSYELSKITKSDITCVVDVSNITGSTSTNANISLKYNDYCWIYGSYQVNVAVTKK